MWFLRSARTPSNFVHDDLHRLRLVRGTDMAGSLRTGTAGS
jgi:hypothetical protein